MNKSNRSVLLVVLILTIFATQIIAQEEEDKDELYMMHSDYVKVDKVTQYEENVKKEIALWKKNGMETSIQYASKTDDNQYNFLTLLNGYADIDKQNEYFTNFTKKAGDDVVKKLYKGYEGTYSSHKNVIIKRNARLSFWPESGKLKKGEAKFLHFDHYYFNESKIEEGMKMMEEFKDLMIEKKSDDGYTVWTQDIGGDIGHVVVVRAAKNNVDYYQEANKRMESMSEQLKKMWPEFSKTLKHFDHNNGVPMPDHLYSPSK